MNPQPQAHGGEWDHGEDVVGQRVMARCDAAEVLQSGEAALDQLPLMRQPCTEVRLRRPTGFGRNVGECPLLANRRPDTICIICLVRQRDCSGADVVAEIVSCSIVTAMPGGQPATPACARSVDGAAFQNIRPCSPRASANMFAGRRSMAYPTDVRRPDRARACCGSRRPRWRVQWPGTRAEGMWAVRTPCTRHRSGSLLQDRSDQDLASI